MQHHGQRMALRQFELRYKKMLLALAQGAGAQRWHKVIQAHLADRHQPGVVMVLR